MLSPHRCQHPHMVRSHRYGLVNLVWCLFGYRPYRCIICDSHRYRRVEALNWMGIAVFLSIIVLVVGIVSSPTVLSAWLIAAGR